MQFLAVRILTSVSPVLLVAELHPSVSVHQAVAVARRLQAEKVREILQKGHGLNLKEHRTAHGVVFAVVERGETHGSAALAYVLKDG